MSFQHQQSFADALKNGNLPAPENTRAWNGLRPRRRFDVYRNNVAASLANALASQFPAAEKIVGTDFFRAMAAAFIQLHPPRSPLLLAYGHKMPDFVETFEPAASLPYLADVMRIEVARNRAYHAEDAAPFDPACLSAMPANEVAALRFNPHPAMTIIRSPHPVVTIWSMNAGEQEPGPIEDWGAEDALVTRPNMLVEVRRLPPGGAIFLSALADGATLDSAIASALEESPEFDLTANLAGMLQAGAFSGLDTFPGDSDEQ